MEEISAFVKGAICDNQCLGRCLYVHGVPGTGKVKVCQLSLIAIVAYFQAVISLIQVLAVLI